MDSIMEITFQVKMRIKQAFKSIVLNCYM